MQGKVLSWMRDRTANQDSSPRNRLESTASLLERVRQGDLSAREELLSRYLPALRRWAHGRLPARARGFLDTDDLVQITLLRTLDHLEEFEPRHEGAFLSYLRRILLNQIRETLRRAARQALRGPLQEEIPQDGPSPLEEAIGKETLEAYEKALATLTEEQREAVVLRIELGLTHAEVAEALGYSSANAARMVVARCLVRIAEVMDAKR